MKRVYGKILGAIAGFILLRPNPVLGALIGGLIGHALDADWFRSSRDDPYRLFGLSAEASDAELEQAYRRLIAQYHPDRLAGAAPELRAQAERKAGEINAAWKRIQKLRRQSK